MYQSTSRKSLLDYEPIDFSRLHIERRLTNGQETMMIFSGICAYAQPKQGYDDYINAIKDYGVYLGDLASDIRNCIRDTEYHQIAFCKLNHEPMGTYSNVIPNLIIPYNIRMRFNSKTRF